MDRERVIKGLMLCQQGFDCPPECPYLEDCNDLTKPMFVELAKDALALLKEQEAVDKNTGEWKNGHCSCCGEDVSSMLDTWTNVQNFLFCPKCGAKMEER